MVLRTWILTRSYGLTVLALLCSLSPVHAGQVMGFPDGALVGGRSIEDLVADIHTFRFWPEAPGINQPGAAYVGAPLENAMSYQIIPADTSLVFRLFAAGEYDSPEECLEGTPGWTPMEDGIARLNPRLLDHDQRMWLNGVPIEFDWENARVNLRYHILFPPGTEGPCIESDGESPVPRAAGISGMFAYIPPQEPGENVLEYYSPGFGLYTRTFVVQDGLIGDLDRSGALDPADIDLLSWNIRQGSMDLVYDRDRNGVVNADDRSTWFDVAGISVGDADLSGTVDFADFLTLSSAFGSEAGWADGDFDGDGAVGFPDFLLLSQNFGTTTMAAAVPEPTAAGTMLLGILGLAGLRRRRIGRLATDCP